jgi:hypothetical protein
MHTWLVFLLLAFLSIPAAARDSEVEDALEEFEDETEIVLQEREDQIQRFWDLDGFFLGQISYAFNKASREPGDPDYDDVVVLREQLSLELDLDLPRDWKARVAGRGFFDFAYRLNDRDDYSNDVLDTHEDELEFQEVWIAGNLFKGLDLKFGRQIVPWGRSETIRVLDILNPLDNREPGVVDIEDLRLPVTMTRLDYYWGKWQLTGIAIHEIRFDENPILGSEFYPFNELRDPNGNPVEFGEQIPGNAGSNTEWAVALTGVFSGWDISFHGARYFSDTPYAEILDADFELCGTFPTDPCFLLPDPVTYTATSVTRHARQTLLGASANLALGNWLLKAETAYIRGLRFLDGLAVVDGELRSLPPGLDYTGSPLTDEKKSRYDIMGGIEYAGFTDTFIALEVANRHIAGFDDSFGLPSDYGDIATAFPITVQRNQLEASLRINRTFMNERLDTTFLAFLVGTPVAADGGYWRLSGDYEVMDALTVGAGVAVYLGGDLATFSGVKNNDRLFMTVKYSF